MRKDDSKNTEQLLQFAKLEIGFHHRRKSILPLGIGNEPAWMMLLKLYVADHFNDRFQTSSLIEEAGCSHASGLRYLALLLEGGYVARVIRETDRRAKYVELTSQGRILIVNYLSSCVEQATHSLSLVDSGS